MTFGDLDRATKYLRFVEEPNPGKKTRQWRIESVSSGQRLGRVGWWGAWRQFVVAPHLDTVWNTGCLQAIQEFMQDALQAWRDDKALQREWELTGNATPDGAYLKTLLSEQPSPQCPTPICSACHPDYACRPDCHICHKEEA